MKNDGNDNAKCGVSSECSPGENQRSVEDALAEKQLRERMSKVRNKVLVLSGKGGVGKSTVAVNLAVALAKAGERVGLLDIDIHGPSVPKMLNIEGMMPAIEGNTITPVSLGDGLKVMSIGLLLQSEDQAVIWRGPLKYSMIRQFLKDVDWGELDYLVVDSPPGTGDEPLSICQLLPGITGAVVVTTPQAVSVTDVKKCITFCRQLKVPILGVVENMSGLKCPHCGKDIELFGSGGGKRLAEEAKVPFLGPIPIDARVVDACDRGIVFVHEYAESDAASALSFIAGKILQKGGEEQSAGKIPVPKEREDSRMKVAIPLVDGKLCMHFGHSQQFALVEVENNEIKNTEMMTPPPHEPGVLPQWLHEKGADLIITGGMGQRAQNLFAQSGVKVVVGASADTPENVVRAYIDGTLQTGQNICDH